MKQRTLILFCTCAGNMKERIKEHSDHIRLHSGLISDTRDQIYSRHSPGLINGTNRVALRDNH